MCAMHGIENIEIQKSWRFCMSYHIILYLRFESSSSIGTVHYFGCLQIWTLEYTKCTAGSCSDPIRPDQTWSDMIRHDQTWSDMIRHDQTWSDLVVFRPTDLIFYQTCSDLFLDLKIYFRFLYKYILDFLNIIYIGFSKYYLDKHDGIY
jgi:hypothetical protein